MKLISKDTVLPHKVTVTVIGEIRVVCYCSKNHMDDDGDFWDNYYVVFGFESIDEIRVDDDDENIVKQKGKYVKTKEYFHDLFKEDGDHPLPVEVHTGVYDEYEVKYEIGVFGEFDPKKLQLIKSDYEFDGMPYFILAEKIMYDGEEFGMTVESETELDDIDLDCCDDGWVVDEWYK